MPNLSGKIMTKEQEEQAIKASNSDAYWRCEQEGYGYAVMDYTDGQEYLDPKTRKLWKEAGDAMDALRDYLESFKHEEI